MEKGSDGTVLKSAVVYRETSTTLYVHQHASCISHVSHKPYSFYFPARETSRTSYRNNSVSVSSIMQYRYIIPRTPYGRHICVFLIGIGSVQVRACNDQCLCII